MIENVQRFLDAGFVLALPFHHGDLEPDCRSFDEREGGGGGLYDISAKFWATNEVNQLGYYVIDLHVRRYSQKSHFSGFFNNFYI